jgi:type I restriction enzyme S subunit
MMPADGPVPSLRFPEFRDAGPWEVKSIADLAVRIAQGGTPATTVAEYWNGGIPWITPAEMGDDAAHHYTIATVRTISVDGLRNSSAELLPANSVIISSRAPIGYVTVNTVQMATNQGCKGIVPCPGVFHEFLYFCLLRETRRLNDIGAGAGFKEISSSSLASFQVCIPSLPEQQKIADCLSSLDDLIRAEGARLGALKDHKRALMQRLFPRPGETTPRLRFPDFRDAGPWEVRRLGEMGTILKGKGIAKSDVKPDGSLPCIRYGEIYTIYGETISDVVSRTDAEAADLVLSEEGDVIIPASGETKEDIATASCVAKAGVALGSDLNVFRSSLSGSFLAYYIRGNLKPLIRKVAQGDSVVHLYPAQLDKLQLAIPSSLPEQQKIADGLTALDDLIRAQGERIEALRSHKRGLMQQLFPQDIG